MKTIKYLLAFALSITIAWFAGGVVSQSAALYGIAISQQAACITFFTVKVLYWVILPKGHQVKGILMAGVNKEIWIDKLKENFYDAYDWLKGVDDWSEWVEYNTINFTLIGADPVILKNNSSWPIVAAQRTDTNGTVVLDTYDSTTTRVRNVEEIEAAINKLESAVKQHRQSLMQEIVTECLWNYAPATAAAGAIAVTGANRAVVIGSQSTVAGTMQLADIARGQEELDARKFPKEGRVLVLSPYHRSDLIKQDITLQKQFAGIKKGEIFDLYGFRVECEANTPLYTKTTLAKKTYGAAADNTNDCIASTVFIQGEVMKAMGDVEMFYKEKGINPEQRADEVGFQMRFKGVPQRTTNFMQLAFVSNRA